MMDVPTIGRTVWYRSMTGFLAPAMVTTTQDTIAPHGAKAWEESEGLQGMPPLNDELHVHLVVYTAGVMYHPGDELRRGTEKPDVPYGGTFREWNIPGIELDDRAVEPGHLGELVDLLPPKSWCWPARFSPSQLRAGGR